MSDAPDAAGALPERYRPRRARVVLLVTLLVMLNLPLVISLGAAWHLTAAGIDTSGEVLETRRLGPRSSPHYFLSFRMADEVDPSGSTWRTEMEPADWAEARRTGEVSLTVLPGDPTSFEVDGARRGREGLWFTLVADAVLLAGAYAALRYGRRAHEAERRRRQRIELSTGRPFGGGPVLRLVATDDLRPAGPGAPHAWRRCDAGGEGTVEVCGEVVAIRDDEVELRVERRRVTVALADHRNHAGFREVARVSARLESGD